MSPDKIFPSFQLKKNQPHKQKARRNCLVCLPSPRAKSLTGRGDWICKDELSEDGIAIAVRECRVISVKNKLPDLRSLFWRHHPDLNWGIKLLQSFALPLGYGAVYIILIAHRRYVIQRRLRFVVDWSERRDIRCLLLTLARLCPLPRKLVLRTAPNSPCGKCRAPCCITLTPFAFCC